jgi:hypothetical protein
MPDKPIHRFSYLTLFAVCAGSAVAAGPATPTPFDGNFNPITAVNAFVDSTIPSGFAPFNIANFGGKIYVAYAKRDARSTTTPLAPGTATWMCSMRQATC